MKVKHLLMIIGAVLIVIVGGILWLGRAPQETPTSNRRPYLTQKNAKKSAVKAVRRPEVSARLAQRNEEDYARVQKVKRRLIAGLRIHAGDDDDGIFRDDDGNPYPAEDQILMKEAERVVEDDDLKGARALAEAALASRNPELRENVVEALGWFGEEAMVELMPFLSDPNEDVADAAKTHWMMGLQEMDDDGEKAGVIEMTLKVLKDNDMVEDVADELIGIDELAALQVLVNVFEDDTVTQEAKDLLKEVYNSITEEDWSGVDAAEEWLQENYEPDDDDDDDDADEPDDDDDD